MFQANWSGEKLINFFPDDAFYYLQTAFNFCKFGIPSFDGINETTGFHPLQLIFTAVGLGFFNKHDAMVAFFLFNIFMITLSSLIFLKGLRAKSEVLGIASISTLGFFNIYIIASSGMESGLVTIFSSLLIYQLLCLEKSSWKLNDKISLKLGLTAGLLVLSRLDMVVALFSIGLLLLWYIYALKKYRQLLICLASFTLVVIPYFVWIYQSQQSFMPISSIAKYGREKADFDGVLTTMTGNSFIGYTILFLIIFTPIFGLILARLNNHKRPLIDVIASSSIIYMIYIFFIAHEPYRWYLTYPLVVASFFTLYILSISTKLVQKLSEKAVLSFCIPATIFVINLTIMEKLYHINTVSSSLLQMVTSVNKKVPNGSNIATDDAGIVGYFATSSIHNLDGLANSKKNWENYLKNRDILGYAKAFNINFLLLRNSALNELIESNQKSNNLNYELIEEYKVWRMSDMKLIKLK